MTTAFVLSGGGSLGAVQVGMLQRAGELIDRARRSSQRWLDEDGHRRPHPERFLSLHTHAAVSPAAADCHRGHAA